jgi:predicted NUDIX family NTP pyrophosphohydrolase
MMAKARKLQDGTRRIDNLSKRSAGLLMFRRTNTGEIEVLLVHPGGPFWAKKDTGAWSIPKGELGEHEDGLLAAQREFEEETGAVAGGQFMELKPIRQPGGKTVHAWAVEGDFDVSKLVSNAFDLEWPPKSGKVRTYPEVDKAEWFDPETARIKILKGQAGLIDQLLDRLAKS